jgi:hypothetical protein
MKLAILLLPLVLAAQPRHNLHPKPAATDPTQLTAAEVDSLVTNAALAADGPAAAIVVSDRAGNALAIYRRPAASDATVEKALALARTGGFFSSNGTPLSSRTVRAISRVNFPEGIPNQAFPACSTPLKPPTARASRPSPVASRSFVVASP